MQGGFIVRKQPLFYSQKLSFPAEVIMFYNSSKCADLSHNTISTWKIQNFVTYITIMYRLRNLITFGGADQFSFYTLKEVFSVQK